MKLSELIFLVLFIIGMFYYFPNATIVLMLFTGFAWLANELMKIGMK